MDVRLPDGTIIKGVPDGMSKADLAAKLKANGYDVSKMSAPAPAPAVKEQVANNGVADAGNALGTGFWRGAARMVGLPVDTVQNVIDLAKVGAGYAYREVTGRPLPDALVVNSDRSHVVGSGDWLLKKARDNGAAFMVDPANPEYEGGYIQAAGGALAGGINSPTTPAQLVNQAALSVSSAALGKAAYDMTGDPALAVAASLAPGAAQAGLTDLTKRAIRGGENGRREMEQRVQDLRNAGVSEPTLGLASGSRMIGGLENLAQNTPGAVSTMQAARDKVIADLRSAATSAADRASPVRGADVAGAAIKRDLSGPFIDRFKSNQGRAYSKVDQLIGGQTPVNVSNTEGALSRLTDTIPGAESTSQGFINARIRQIKHGFDVDTGTIPATPDAVHTVPGWTAYTGGSPYAGVGGGAAAVPKWVTIPGHSVQVPSQRIGGGPAPFSGVGGRSPDPERYTQAVTVRVPSRTVQLGGSPFAGLGVPGPEVARPVEIPTRTMVFAAPRRRVSHFSGAAGHNFPLADPELPYEAVRKLRSNVGSELADAGMAPDVPTSQWKQLYAGLSEDMKRAAAQSGNEAEAAWRRANGYTKAGMQRIDRVQPYANAKAPEQAFTMLMNTTRENNSTLQAVKKSVTPETRATVAATVIDRLGRARPSAQNELGDAWSPETFLTNWNTMTPKARQELFSGFKEADQVRAQVESVAKATSMMRDSSKMWANPSGTSASLAARVALGAAPLSVLLDPMAPLYLGGGLLSSRITSGLLTSQDLIKYATKQGVLSNAAQRANAGALLSSGLLSEQQ